MKRKRLNYVIKVTLVYWLVGLIWIYLSDYILAVLILDPVMLTKVQNYKGWFFVTGSAILIYVLFRYYSSKERAYQNALRESEDRFRSIFDTANVGKSITSLDGEVNGNKAFAEMLGYTRVEELNRKSWQSITPENEIKQTQEKVDQLLSGEKNSVRFNKHYLKKDGSLIWADVSIAIRRETNGKPLYFITTVVDITAQNKAEQALQHSHDLMQYIIEHNRSSVAVHDKNLNYIYVSQRYLQEYNVTEKEVIGKHHYEVFPDLPQKWRDVHQRALAGEILSAEDDPYFRADGSVEWTRWECRPWYEADGTIGGIIVYTEVITQRKQMEQALKESEERLRLAVESAKQGIYDVNLQTGQIVVNDSYPRMLGYEPESYNITMDSWLESIHPDEREKVRKNLDDYINGLSQDYHNEFRMKNSKGQYLWVLSIGRIVEFDDYGKPLRLLGIHTNISESKNLEIEKNLFINLFETSLNEIFVFDARSLIFKQVNQAALDNLGYIYEEILKMSPLDIKPFVNQGYFERLVAPLRKQEKDVIIFETVHQRKNGSQYPVEVHLQLHKFGHENLFAAIVMDISERKRTEEILKSDRERLEGIIDGTNVGTWDWYVQSGELVINDRWAEIVGYTRGELAPTTMETWNTIVHPDDLKKSNELVQQLFRNELEYYEIELRMKHKNGHWVWVLDRGKVTSWSKDGKPILMQGTHQDITQRKNNEAKIIEQLEELRRWHAVTLGREERILELKKEVNGLLKKANQPVRYQSLEMD